jgi:hypothetical protein
MGDGESTSMRPRAAWLSSCIRGYNVLDVEGMEMKVLESLDFSRYRPKLIIAEVLGCHSVEDLLGTPIVQFMRERVSGLFAPRLFGDLLRSSDRYLNSCKLA